MTRRLAAISMTLTVAAQAADTLRADLELTYGRWRDAVVRRDAPLWQQTTAPHRRMEVKNRIVSEKRAFPAAVFDLPAPPPTLKGLTFLEARRNGPTAKASYFGKVDFGVGGKPTDNLLVLSFVRGRDAWLYDRADFVNLHALPEVRKELAAGNLKYLQETPETRPAGVVPPVPIEAPPAKYIAKVYVFCPGREVRVQINKISHHRFANARESEVVIGGAFDGANEVQYAIKKLDGAKGNEVMTLRVYLMSQVPGVMPVKVFEYQIAQGGQTMPFGTGSFTVDGRVAAKLAGR